MREVRKSRNKLASSERDSDIGRFQKVREVRKEG